MTVPNVYGGSSQYVVTSTGLNQTGETSKTMDVSGLSDQVRKLMALLKLPVGVCLGLVLVRVRGNRGHQCSLQRFET